MKIELTADEDKLLKSFAKVNKLTAEEYASNIVKSFCQSHIRGYFNEKIKNLSVDELKQKLGDIE